MTRGGERTYASRRTYLGQRARRRAQDALCRAPRTWRMPTSALAEVSSPCMMHGGPSHVALCVRHGATRRRWACSAHTHDGIWSRRTLRGARGRAGSVRALAGVTAARRLLGPEQGYGAVVKRVHRRIRSRSRAVCSLAARAPRKAGSGANAMTTSESRQSRRMIWRVRTRSEPRAGSTSRSTRRPAPPRSSPSQRRRRTRRIRA